MDRDWVHDRFEDEDDEYGRPIRGSNQRYQRNDRRSPPQETAPTGSKIRVENLHYEITEDDLRELFSRKGPVTRVQLLYDRQDRSEGVAFVTYEDRRDAQDAIHDFNGANARGQPIRLTLLANVPPAAQRARNPFDTAERPSKSLFDRVEGGGGRDYGSRRERSASPGRRDSRRSNIGRGAPENIDRYVPGGSDNRRNDRNDRNDSRGPRRDGGRDRERGGRRPGEGRRGGREGGRDGGRGPRTDDDGHPIVAGRPKKTAEELDAEMADYWNKSGGAGGDEGAANGSANTATVVAAAGGVDDDIDMIE